MTDLIEALLARPSTGPNDDGWRSTRELCIEMGWEPTSGNIKRVLTMLQSKRATVERSKRPRPSVFDDDQMIPTFVYRKKPA